MSAAPVWGLDVGEYPVALAWAPGAELLAVARGDGAVALAAGDDGRPLGVLEVHPAPLTAAAWSPAEATLATAGHDGAVRLVRPDRGVVTLLAPGPTWTEHLAWHPRGKRLAVARGRQVLVLDPASGHALTLPALESTAAGVAWSPDGRQLAAACYGGVRLFDAVDGTLARRLDWKASLLGVAWRPDGKVIAGGCQDATVHFWRLPGGRDAQMSGFVAKPRDVAWTGDGAWLVTGGGETICLWPFDRRGPEGRAPLELAGHDQVVSALAAAPLTSVLVSGDRGGEVCVWTPPEATSPVARYALGAPASAAAWGLAPAAGTARWAVGAASGRVIGGAL